MLTSALDRTKWRIDTSNIIVDGDFIEEPEEVLQAITKKAKTWTRPRIYSDPDDF